MRARMALLAAFLLVLVAVAHPTSTVLACSGGPVGPADTDAVITGRVTDLSVVPSEAAPSGMAAHVTFEVDRYLVGAGPDTLVAVDTNSLIPTANGPVEELVEDGEYDFAGSAGACGALDLDPRGQYWVVGVLREADGTLRMSLPLRYATGTDAADPAVREAVADIGESLRAVGLQPAPAGTAGISGDRERPLSPAEIVAIVLAAGAVVLLGRYTTKRPSR